MLKRFGVRASLALLATFSIGAHASRPVPAPAAPMKKDAPMPTPMAKPGIKVGDVQQAAAKKDKVMQPMIEKESAAMKK